MLFFDFFIIIALFFLTIPLVAGYYAYTRGRSFWFWFVMGTFLPVFAHLVLALLPRIKDEKAEFEEELSQMRLELGVTGTFDEKTNNKRIDKVLNDEKQKVRFFAHEYKDKKVVEIYINGVNLRYIISEFESLETNEYEGMPLSVFQSDHLHLLGIPHIEFSDNENRSSLLLCKSDSYYRSALMAKIEVTRKHVIWHNFQRNQKPNQQYKQLVFVFNKIQYMNALNEIKKSVNTY
jgi:hypothetical protein